MLHHHLLRNKGEFLNLVPLCVRQYSIQSITSKNVICSLNVLFQKPENKFISQTKIVPNYLHFNLLHTTGYKFNKEVEPPKLEDEKPKEEPIPLGKRLVIVAVFLSMCGLTYYLAKSKKKEITTVKREEQLSKVDIGAADYNLIDHTGKAVSKKDFLGKWLLLYFGFTHCPDICPEELEKMAEIVDDVDKDHSVPDIQPIFISVDPDRDTPEAISEYIKEFHKKFIGLTGSMDQIKQATKAFRVYFSNGPKDADNDYIVDHTIVMYLMNPKGNFVDYYGSRSVPKEKIVSGIKKNMKNYARLHG